jgi:hypothetical protein
MISNLKKIDWVKWIIIILGAWLLIYPKPYKVLVTLLVSIPLITLIIHGIMGKRPGISTLFQGLLNGASNFSPMTHMCFATILLGFRVFMDYDSESMLVFIGVGLVATLLLSLLLLSTHKPEGTEDDSFHFSILALLFLFYAPTAMFGANCVYDNTESQLSQVKVIEKFRPTSSIDADYYLKVSSWSVNPEPIDIEVSFDKYHNAKEGDIVDVHVGKGLFGVGWYRVEL